MSGNNKSKWKPNPNAKPYRPKFSQFSDGVLDKWEKQGKESNKYISDKVKSEIEKKKSELEKLKAHQEKLNAHTVNKGK